MKYRLVKNWDETYTLQELGVYNFDGIIDNHWYDREKYDDLGFAIDAACVAIFGKIPACFCLALEYDEKAATVHADFEEAEDYAISRGLWREKRDGVEKIIEFTEHNEEEFHRCAWCDEFFPLYDIEEYDGICYQCDAAIRSRGERWGRR